MRIVQDIKNMVVGTTNFFLRRKILPTLVREQILYRMSQCDQCLLRGKCPHCPCSVPDLFFAPEKVDGENKWPNKFYTDWADWNNYKKHNNVSMWNIIRNKPSVFNKYKELFKS